MIYFFIIEKNKWNKFYDLVCLVTINFNFFDNRNHCNQSVYHYSVILIGFSQHIFINNMPCKKKTSAPHGFGADRKKLHIVNSRN